MENEKHYRDLIQNLPEAIYTCDETGVIKLYNKAAVNLWGRVPVEGKDLWCGSWKIFNAKGAHLPFDKYPMAIAVKESRTVYGTEIVIQRPDGSVRHVNPYTTPLFNAEGRLTGAVNILKEVTQKEDIQKQGEEKYKTLIEQASDAILIYSFDGTIHEFNKSCYTLLGYSQQEYATLKLNDILVGDIIVNQANYTAILAGHTKTLYRYLKRKDGTLIETEVTVKILADGKAIAFARDITERKKAEEAIKKEKELSNSIINSLPGVFYLLDENLKFLRWNKNLETVTGYNADEIAGMHPLDFFDDDEKGSITEKITKIFKEGVVYVEASFLTKDSKKIPYYLTGYKIENDGKVELIGVGIDIKERKKVEKDLEQMKQELMDQKIQEQKKITRAIIKAEEKERRHIGEELHDNINQMLAGTKLYLSAAGNNNKELKELVQYPIKLIEDTMKEIRLLTSKAVTPIQNIDLKELVQSLLEALDKTSTIKTLFTYNVINDFSDDDLKLNIYRIIQEQTNNIIKHAEAGNIEILIEEGNNIINIAVTDDGNGFDVCKKRKGIGISNIINRVESFNGKAVLKSSKGKGCELQIKIPLI